MATEIKSAKPKIITPLTIITFDNKRFVVGLKWQNVKTLGYMKEIKRIGKEKHLDIVAIRKSSVTQAGFAEKTGQRLRGAYSLSVTLSSLISGAWIGVFPVDDTNEDSDYILIAVTERGAIFPLSDVVIPKSEVKQAVIDVKSDLKGAKDNQDIPVYGDSDVFMFVTKDLKLKDILISKNLKKAYKLVPLTWGMTKTQISLLVSFLVFTLFGVIAYNIWQSHLETKRLQEQAIAQAALQALNKEARYKTAQEALIHPWIKQASVEDFIAGCRTGYKRLPLSLGGWIPVTVDCSVDSINALFARPPDSGLSVGEFYAAVIKKLGVEPTLNISQSSAGSVTLKIPRKPNGDESVLGMNEQINKLVSILQSQNINFSLTQVADKEQEKNEFGEDIPLPDWREMTFSFESDISPFLIFNNKDLSGVRLSNISMDINSEFSVAKYKTSGVIYGTR
ncbi:pilus assembly protein PilO [Buttiauxella sp. B2]|uniref:type 4b pilus protein PilO2 n=1 Tax=Buttiauxella sp. B2 TaxID=2587812 RepID=UPI00111FC624|nr:type 4b pilus protein PilO2 [Buttiauxella sp. B2]TNV16097.1 pilus assembly protein PilO [Buttiauxella sp. B2]